MASPDELYFLFLCPNSGPNHIMVSLALSFVTPKYLTRQEKVFLASCIIF